MLDILYEDKFIVCCVKPQGVISEYVQGKTNCMPEIVKKHTGAYKIDVLHRLDKPVGGVMVFSKNQKATAQLSKMILARDVTKQYLAIVSGEPQEKQGVLQDILFRDSKLNKSFVVKSERKGTKFAELEYEVLQTKNTKNGKISLVKIELHTGRTHQIRVQFASRKMSLLGDVKYGNHDECDIALFSYKLAFNHPVLKDKRVEVSALPSNKYPWNLFDLKNI